MSFEVSHRLRKSSFILLYCGQTQVDAETDDGNTKTPEDLARCHALLEEVTAHKLSVEELSDRCESLMELSACPWVRDQTVQLQSAYTNLLTSVQG